jgi:hypothetical protein
MEYDVFLSYAFPTFGIALLVLIALSALLKFSKKESPPWVGALIIYGILAAGGVMVLIAWFLPWGSPI